MTLLDCLAGHELSSRQGRVTQAGLVGRVKDFKGSAQSLRPDEVLFKQLNAPVRYEESDDYCAHARLPKGQHLPSSDLLSTLHAYISMKYCREAQTGSQRPWKCMDETALIAFGILIEETVREVLGDSGDLALTEAACLEEVGRLREYIDEESQARRGGSDAHTEASGDAWSSADDDSRYATGDSE